MIPDSLGLREWETRVRAALAAWSPAIEPSTRAFILTAEFYFRRPKAHFNARGELRAKYAEHHDFRPVGPDVDKLLRAICDAASGVVYVDDRQVVQVTATKYWRRTREGVEGMLLRIEELEGP